MALLKHSSRNRLLAPPRWWVLFSFIASGVNAEIFPLFNPLAHSASSHPSLELSSSGFIADDPVSLKDFFNDWEGEYSPESSDNYAVEMLRVDIGTTLPSGYYIGYFYQWDTLIHTNRGFVEGYYRVKNNLTSQEDQAYGLQLAINGIERHGLVVSRSWMVYRFDSAKVTFGAGVYLSYDTDSQDGILTGDGTLYSDSSYSATAISDYYYTDNLLYDLDVDDTYGIGYGMHIALRYEHQNGIMINLLANDLFARSHWKNLPYSLVYLETENQSIGDDGYVSYDPTIHGWELYKDHVQHIEPKYHIDIQKKIDLHFELSLGYEYCDGLGIPYIQTNMQTEYGTFGLQYETRFGMIGVDYRYGHVSLSLFSDGFEDASALGFSGKILYNF